MSKIKYYKNIKLEEFLDETIKECTEAELMYSYNEMNNEMNNTKISKCNSELNSKNIIDSHECIEIVEVNELVSDITFEITKIKGMKKLVLTVNIYDETEIIKLDFEIKKTTLKKLLKDLDD